MSYGLAVYNASGTKIFDNSRAGRVLHSTSLIGNSLALPSWRTTTIYFPDLTIPVGRTIEVYWTRPRFEQAGNVLTMTVTYPTSTTARVSYVANTNVPGYSIVYFFLK